MAACAPYESPLLRQVTGPALRPGGLDLTRRALELAGFAPGDRVMDIGCGLGATAGLLAREHGLQVVGLDLSATMLRDAGQAHPGLVLVQGSGDALPLVSASLGGVLCECVLSLLPRPHDVLAQCHRVLRPNGRLVVSDLYLRNPPTNGGALDLPGCLGGALPREGVPGLAAETGFEVEAWEDHSPFLRELAARLVWSHGSADALWGACGGGDCSPAREAAAQARPGYFLMVARRKG